MIDYHCHLNFQVFEKDFDVVIKRAFDSGVTKIINVGTKLDSSRKAIELAEKYNSPAGELYATVGIHPHHADKLEKGWEQQLEDLAKDAKVVAVGETGLDFYSYESNGITNPNLQKKLFIKQIEIAHKLKLPLQIHNRQAGSEILDILISHKSDLLNPPGVFHCFSGDIEFLRKVLDLGFYIGFDGNITYKGIAKGETTDLKDLVKYTPIDRIVTETDSPYLTPVPNRGQRNEPKYVIIVAQAIGEIKSLTFEEIDRITTENANNIFKFK
ncbi:MAG: TatD family hydrolase [Candidatus Levybacteria bacterium]|nr:TatD family hydrolase [Candidatus Levybacteria bacterium]